MPCFAVSHSRSPLQSSPRPPARAPMPRGRRTATGSRMANGASCIATAPKPPGNFGMATSMAPGPCATPMAGRATGLCERPQGWPLDLSLPGRLAGPWRVPGRLAGRRMDLERCERRNGGARQSDPPASPAGCGPGNRSWLPSLALIMPLASRREPTGIARILGNGPLPSTASGAPARVKPPGACRVATDRRSGSRRARHGARAEPRRPPRA